MSVEVVEQNTQVEVEAPTFSVQAEPDGAVVVQTEQQTTAVSTETTAVTVVVEEPPATQVQTVAPPPVDVVLAAETGPKGEPATLVSPTQPVTTLARYLWIQTGLGPTGTDMTFWVEDGTP